MEAGIASPPRASGFDHQDSARWRPTSNPPDTAGRHDGVRGKAVAARILEGQANDRADAPERYRLRTTTGVYFSTGPLAAAQWPEVQPFAMTSARNFRPATQVSLASGNGRTTTTRSGSAAYATAQRSARQSEDARFRLAVDGAIIRSTGLSRRDAISAC